MTQKLQQLIREADTLTAEEQKLLLTHLATTRRNGNGAQVPYRWSDLRGRAPGLTGTGDAQQWVSDSRREDQHNSDRGTR